MAQKCPDVPHIIGDLGTEERQWEKWSICEMKEFI
jgi:hypothetical protein